MVMVTAVLFSNYSYTLCKRKTISFEYEYKQANLYYSELYLFILVARNFIGRFTDCILNKSLQ